MPTIGFKRTQRILVGGVLAILLLGFCWKLFFAPQATPFSASIDTTSVEFTTAEDVSQDPDSQQRGLLGSDSTINIHVEGCSKLERTSTLKEDAIACPDDSFDTTNVQLSHVSLPAGTEIKLWVLDHAVHMQVSPPVGSVGLEIRVTSNEDSANLSSRGKASLSGEWRIVTSGRIITLTLADGNGSQLLLNEQAQDLGSGSEVRFRSKHGNPISEGSLRLPQLPKDLEEMKLGNGTFSLRNLQTGMLRQLSLKRDADGIQSLHVELTGQSDSLYVYDKYTATEQNEALTWFDANSGKDPRLKLLSGLLLIGALLTVLSVVSTVYSNYVQVGAAKVQKKVNERNLLNASGDREFVRIADALEQLNEITKMGPKDVLGTHSLLPASPSANPGKLDAESRPDTKV